MTAVQRTQYAERRAERGKHEDTDVETWLCTSVGFTPDFTVVRSRDFLNPVHVFRHFLFV